MPQKYIIKQFSDQLFQVKVQSHSTLNSQPSIQRNAEVLGALEREMTSSSLATNTHIVKLKVTDHIKSKVRSICSEIFFENGPLNFVYQASSVADLDT